MGNPVVHFEVRSKDPDASRDFYGPLFGWDFPPGGIDGYTYIETGVDGALPGGISPIQGGEALVTFFVGVEDVTAALEKAVGLGGTVVQPATSVPGHCYRMLGSGADAEEAVQDTLERAWRRLGTYDGSGAFGAWLHHIASNGCIDRLRTSKRRANPLHNGPASNTMPPAGVPDLSLAWTEPVADTELGIAGDPAAELIRKEHISLAFVAALQVLRPRQRAVLLLCDVLGFTHSDVAATLDTNPGSVNSLLYRARQQMETLAARTGAMTAPEDPAFKKLLADYVRAWELADVDELVSLLVDDIGFSMPPLSDWYQGITTVVGFIEAAVFAPARPTGIPLRGVRVNRQPAFVVYDPGDDERRHPTGLQVLDIVGTPDGPRLQHITSYRGPEVIAAARLVV